MEKILVLWKRSKCRTQGRELEVEEERLQLIVAELCNQQELCPLPGEQAIMHLIVREKQVSSESSSFFLPGLPFYVLSGRKASEEVAVLSMEGQEKEVDCLALPVSHLYFQSSSVSFDC